MAATNMANGIRAKLQSYKDELAKALVEVESSGRRYETEREYRVQVRLYV